MLSILPKFSQLKEIEVFDSLRDPWKVYHARFEDYCPVGRSDDRMYRSHPTLQEVQILSWYRWIWLPEDGWRAIELREIPPDYFCNIFAEVRILYKFTLHNLTHHSDAYMLGVNVATTNNFHLFC